MSSFPFPFAALRLGGLSLSLVLLFTPSASAQVHWDAGAQAGVTQRFTTGGASGAPAPELGPSVQLTGHLALVPMVRVGAYVGADVAPVSTGGPRAFGDAGLHVRLTPPLAPWPWRTWLYLGFGYAYADDLGAHLPGGMLEAPVGLGLGSKVGKRWLVFTELGARIGFGFYGRMYDAAAVAASGGANGEKPAAAYVGQDTVALSLTVGLSLEE